MRTWLVGLGLLMLLALAGAALLTWSLRPPVYEVWLDGRLVGSGSDLKALDAAVAEAAAQQQGRQVALTAGEQRWTFRWAELGLSAPAEPLADVAAAALAATEEAAPGAFAERLLHRLLVRVDLQTAWDPERLELALLSVKAALGQEPVAAALKIEGRTPVIIPEVSGRSVDATALLSALQAHPDAESLQVPLQPRPPAVTAQSLTDMHISRLVAEWSTAYDPTVPRGENVARAARAFNGVMVAPGEILSYNATVGPVDAENGWKEAWVIESGKLVPGIGGGVCQVATTFYGAALRAGLEILERHQHSLAITYVPPSQDAAIAQPTQDLKILNTLPGYLYIETEARDGTVTFRLYGEMLPGQEVKVESRVLGTIPYPTQRVRDPALAPGQSAVRTAGSPGLTSEAVRLIYQDGTLVRTEKLSRDSYLPTPQVVAWN